MMKYNSPNHNRSYPQNGIRLSVMFAIIIWCFNSQAGELIPHDFAYGFDVIADKQNSALWEIELPDEVYRKVTRSNLADIRVFNKTDNIVPHAIDIPDIIEVPPAVSLPFFPLYGNKDELSSHQTIQIKTNEQGTVIDTWHSTDRKRTTGYINAFLIDSSSLDRAPDKLILNWECPDEKGFSAIIRVEGCNDLTNWRTIVDRKTLAQLSYDQANLLQNEIDLPLQQVKYLHLTWPVEMNNIRLNSINALFPVETSYKKHQFAVQGVIVNENGQSIIEFDTRGCWPIVAVRLRSSEQNMFVKGRLFSRLDIDHQWRLRYQGLFYKLHQNDIIFESSPISVWKTVDRYWRFEPDAGTDNVAGTNLSLQVEWLPHNLVFVAQGTGPYTVAFGNAGIEKISRQLDQLISTFSHDDKRTLMKTTQPTSIYPLGGDTRLQPPVEPFPWRTAVLWAVLVAGVLFLAILIRHLARQISSESEPE